MQSLQLCLCNHDTTPNDNINDSTNINSSQNNNEIDTELDFDIPQDIHDTNAHAPLSLVCTHVNAFSNMSPNSQCYFSVMKSNTNQHPA